MSRALETLASSLQQRFGQDVSCAVIPVAGDPARLWREERELIDAAVPARQREFAAGRACARLLLAGLGFEPAPLLWAADRSPLWPRGAIGSITHDGHRCAVAVARAARLCALGLDLEPDEPLEPELWPELFRPSEFDLLARSARAGGRMARLLFSAKECVYKATSALGYTTLDFQDVEIVLYPCKERFRARVHPPAGAALSELELEGFYVTGAGSIATGMKVAAPSRAGRPCSVATP
jgi:4'-phosphopantetheinyl transferase EntD